MESLSLSHSVVNNLNATLSHNKQIQRHLQTGRKIINNHDDSGGLGSITRLNSTLLRNQVVQQNLQNALSFTQAQDGALSVVGKILLRSSELKVKFESPFSDQATKQQYDEEFGEIQKELGQMADAKWNGISLFSTGDTSVLFGGSPAPHNLNAVSSDSESVIAIQRSEIFDKFKIIKSPKGATSAVDSGGKSEEYRTTIDLIGSKGKLTLWQWPGGAPDAFKVIHGTEVLHDQAYGDTKPPGSIYTSLTLNNGTTYTKAAGTLKGEGRVKKGHPNGLWLTNYKDEIRFGDTGNKSSTLTLIVNESGRTSTSTTWDMEYNIEYDPYPLDLADKSRTWSLNDFDMSDFDNFQEVLTTARAQNGSEQSRIKHELDGLQTKQVGLEGALENADGVDYSLIMTKYTRLQDKLHLNANLVSAAKEMENILYTDYLEE